MILSTKNEAIILFVVLAAAFAAGRYSVSQPTITTSEQTKTNEQQQENKNTHTTTTTTTTKEPTGEEKTTTTVDTTTTIAETQKENTVSSEQQTVTAAKSSKVSVSALAGINFTSLTSQPSFGISVSKEVLGPVTAGVWGLTNGNFGVSLGLDF